MPTAIVATAKVSSAPVQTATANVPVFAGVVLLPKMRRDGRYIETAIDVNAIIGVESAKVRVGTSGKTVDGSRIFTKQGDFYVLLALDVMAQGWHKVRQDGTMLSLTPAPQHQQFKALGSGK